MSYGYGGCVRYIKYPRKPRGLAPWMNWVDIKKYEKQFLLKDIADQYEYEMKEMEIMPDHIHLFVSTKPTVSPTDVVRTLKSNSAIELFKRNQKLKSFYSRCGSLWSKGYFVV